MNKFSFYMAIFLGCSIISLPSFASGLDAQLSQIHQLEKKAKADQDAAKREQEKKIAESRRQHAAALATERKLKEAKAQAQYEKIESERIADKKREQEYENLKRQLEIEEMKIQLSKKRKRAEREDDFIDIELKHVQAQTDILRSEADAQRNISEGAKELMIKSGEAEVKKNSGWFK